MSDGNSCSKKRTIQQREDEDQETLEEVYEIPSNGGLMSKLPTEIFFDILFRLSIKDLSICRFVCKSWFYTIKNPCFLTTYNSNILRNNDSSWIIFRKGDYFRMVDIDHKSLGALGTPLTLYTPKLPPHQGYHSIYSCNGLLFWVSNEQSCCICNPITGDHISFPLSPFYKEYPFTFRNIFGFGYDTSSKVSKVIMISYTRGGVYVQVYNVGMGKWSMMQEKDISIRSCKNGEEVLVGCLRLFNNTMVPNVFINGALHWIALPIQQLKAIISFKLDTEEFQLLPLPLGFSFSFGAPRGRNAPPATNNYLLLIEGCLSLVEYVDNGNLAIWVMKDYGLESSWEKKYIINDVIENLYSISGPIQSVQSGDILLKTLDRNLGYYHPVTKLYRPIDIGHGSNGYVDLEYMDLESVHVGSLFSPQNIAK